ncbi:exodeoxyribonuclease VII large subunit [Thermophagus xiamenensis]|uniref:Exodeoxyribonuclease 7 large subunit n=1 Tax=Thermophagus xiamenensis TaxID=385682 RepID=A0A1I1VIM3_9BACT|nr:exodeoxyribonuclease VII large subunit [Thermophagus xiamenensis]SFD81888.1 Exodeoxyribonuclease VII large subunit [Thermophagus xiamenensis]
MGQEAITLLQLNQIIKGIIDDAGLNSVWVKAEIGELRVNRNGHCYLDLVEKNPENDSLVARSRGMIWAQNFRLLKAYFESSTGRPLTTGLKVLVKASVQFQEVYGLSLIITDIDPSYTMGDLAQKRREVVNRLIEEGVFEMNKELELPAVIQKIAIISSPTAAGYGDFIHQLENNPYGIKFYFHLFPALMQGEKAENSIVEALEKIFDHSSFFDAVVLIRGGGATIDLLCFDSYWVAYHIAQFPLPVITGIGHERDESVADMVAHTMLKTPTAVAAFLIERAAVFLQRVDEAAAQVADLAREKIQNEQQTIENLSKVYVPTVKTTLQRRRSNLEQMVAHLPVVVTKRLGSAAYQLKRFQEKMVVASKHKVNNSQQLLNQYYQSLRRYPIRLLNASRQKLDYLEQAKNANDPVRLLKRGYSLTYQDGKLVKNIGMIKKGYPITTRFIDGRVSGTVEHVAKLGKKE